METIQVVLDKALLVSANKAARRAHQNRSQLIREALQNHLRLLELRAKEDQEREGYLKHPQDPKEIQEWEAVQVWPEE